MRKGKGRVWKGDGEERSRVGEGFRGLGGIGGEDLSEGQASEAVGIGHSFDDYQAFFLEAHSVSIS